MKRKLCLVCLLAFIWTFVGMNGLSEEGENAIDHEKEILVEHTLEQASMLSDVIQTSDLMERSTQRLDSDVVEMVKKTDFSMPDYAIIVVPTAEFESRSIMANLGFHENLLNYVCFSVIYDANLLYTNGLFADWSNTMSIYDTMNENEHEIAYVVLVYGKDSPQVATAFCNTEEGDTITKTSIVYNTNLHSDAIYATLPDVAEATWKDVEILLYEFQAK